MKSTISAVIALTALIFIVLACNASFTTANISSFNFGKNEKADPPSTSFDVGEKIYAVANVANTSSKHKMKFNIIFENVEGKSKGEEALNKEIEFEGSRPVFLFFDAPIPGEYKVEAILFDEQGKELDKKSGTVTVKGDSPGTTTDEPTDSDDSPDSDSDSSESSSSDS